MERGRPKKAEIRLSAQEHADLQVLACSRSLPHSVVRRAQIILMSADGYSNTAIAEHFGLTLPSVGHWRKRYLSQGIAGLYDVARSGRPRSYDDANIATLLNKVLKDKPKRATHWGARTWHPRKPASPKARFNATCICLEYSRIAASHSSSPPILSLLRRYVTLLVCT